jgi:predicted nucleotidyltransferase
MDSLMVEQLQLGMEAEESIRLAYLYGSVTFRPDPQDVDVAVWVSGFQELNSAHKVETQLHLGAVLERCLCPRRPLDLLILNSAPLPMQFSVVRKGEVLLARSELERIRYEAWVVTAFLDFAPSLRPFEESLLAGIL